MWTREVKDSKVYWDGVNGGTESSWWGERISLPVNAPGDIIIEAQVRQKWYGGAGLNSIIDVAVNNTAVFMTRTGEGMSLGGASSNFRHGYNAGALTPLPGFPSRVYVGNLGADVITKFRIVRKNGYLFLYGEGTFLGQFAYAATITSVDILALWNIGAIACQKWIDWIKVWPSSVVL